MPRKKKRGLIEFENFVDTVWWKWDNRFLSCDAEEKKAKEYLTSAILRCWGNPEKMVWWQTAHDSKRWCKGDFGDYMVY